MLGSTAAGENRAGITFGLWEVPRYKAKVVPQTIPDLAFLVESLPENWQRRLLLPGVWEPREQTFPLQREHFPGLREEQSIPAKGGRSIPQAVHPTKLCSDMQVFPPPSGLAFPWEGCEQHLLLSQKPQPVPHRGPGTGTGEPTLTESNDRLHLQHGVP